MREGRFISYLRVSTQKQGKSGLGIEAQRADVLRYLGGNEPIEEVMETESGKNKNRPGLARALSLCRLHDATLVVAKLDRLARNVAFISALMESGVKFVAVDLPEANELTVHIMAAMAEYEAKAISARTKAALKAAKERGTPLGGIRERWRNASKKDLIKRARAGAAASAEKRRSKIAKRAADLIPEVEALRAEGKTTLRQLAAGLNNRRIRAPRGGNWSAAQVRRVMHNYNFVSIISA